MISRIAVDKEITDSCSRAKAEPHEPASNYLRAANDRSVFLGFGFFRRGFSGGFGSS
jgi:hypothetical protein